MADNNQVNEVMMDGKTIRKLVKEGMLTKVCEKVKSEYKHRLPMNPKTVARNTWYKTLDGCVFSLRTEKNLQNRFLETFGRKKYDEIQKALNQNSVDELLEKGCLELLGENKAPLIEDIIDVSVYHTPKGSEVFVSTDEEKIIPTSEKNMELYNLLKTNSLKKLIAFKRLVKVRDDKMPNPVQGKEDPYMMRHKIKFAKFYAERGVVIFVDRFKKLLSSEQSWQQSNIDYKKIQKILDAKTLDKLLSEKYLLTECPSDEMKKLSCELQSLYDPSLVLPLTNYKTKEGAKIRLNKHKQIQKGVFKQKGVDYNEIQNTLNENSITNLITQGYLKEVEESAPKVVEPEELGDLWKYKGEVFVVTDGNKISDCKGKEAESLRVEFQKLLETKSMEDLLYNGIIRKFYVRKGIRRAAATNTYRTTDKLDYTLEFVINLETQYLYGRVSEAATELFNDSSLDKLLDEGIIEKVEEFLQSENMNEVTKRPKQLKSQCWINPAGERVFINVETLQPHGRVTKSIKEKLISGETLRDMIRGGYLQRLIIPGEMDKDEGGARFNAKQTKKMQKRRSTSTEENLPISPKRHKIADKKLKTAENCGKDLSNVTCRCAGSYGYTSNSSGKGRRRRQKCGKCLGCTKPDCGTCYHCKDMIKFGGAGTMKQRCMYKFCENPRIPNCPCFS